MATLQGVSTTSCPCKPLQLLASLHSHLHPQPCHVDFLMTDVFGVTFAAISAVMAHAHALDISGSAGGQSCASATRSGHQYQHPRYITSAIVKSAAVLCRILLCHRSCTVLIKLERKSYCDGSFCCADHVLLLSVSACNALDHPGPNAPEEHSPG